VGRVLGGMTPSPPWPVRDACARRAHENLGDFLGYPEVAEAEARAVELISLASLSRRYPGKMTSGATESNILALLYWRDFEGKRRVLATPHTHYSIRKAARLLGLEYVEAPASAAGPKDIVVATIGTTELGLVDRPPGDLERAAEAGAGVHVDAAYAGPIARFLDPRLAIDLDAVKATYAVDFHKIPEAPPPAGALLAWSEEVLERLWNEAPYLPGGRQFGLLGTRPGCAAHAALAAMRLIVYSWPGGPKGLALDLDRLAERVGEHALSLGYRVEGGPMPVRCIHGPGLAPALERMGVRYYTCRGSGVRFVAMPHLIWEGYGWVLEALEAGARG